MKRSLGICIGASNIKIVQLNWENDNFKIEKKSIIHHESHPKEKLLKEIEKYDLKRIDYISVTGRKFKEIVSLPKISEPEALEYFLSYCKEELKANTLLSLGSENFILYELDDRKNIINVKTGNKCASGTGEFFFQQIRRMNLETETAIKLAENSKPHKVSGRCSVFCKSDCTHALNKGVPIGEVTAGLGNMLAEKVTELLENIENPKIVSIGGVTENSYVMDKLKEKNPNFYIPENANISEAVGAAIYAFKNKTKFDSIKIKENHQNFTFLPAISKGKKLVSYKKSHTINFLENDECILGIDVGSTTTKAVLLRQSDNGVGASVYLRTNGNPIKAAKKCYEDLLNQLSGKIIKISGLGVTGSGRYLVGLHAMTDGIINEIIAHATAAAYYDKDVDTIFEIGGQDAKYTFLHNGIPCDYAMNEACSAGTGSFLEEAALENLNINYLDIEKHAFNSQNPPNFNDQCSAFISSDIKNASHDNISKENIIAGLVYSICMNYRNRVKGDRKVGKKIFMQGGVCYNKAVPAAMANLIQKEIIVPPDPGLIGAFGVALEVKKRIENKLLPKMNFDLSDLIKREVEYKVPFICEGIKENCDRNCKINLIKINDKTMPFGGICDKYYNQNHHVKIIPEKHNYVKVRQKLIFQQDIKKAKKKIGVLKSFLTNTLYPLYHHFFQELGFEIVLSQAHENNGKNKTNSSFCYPVEISHALFQNLLAQDLDYIFIPHIVELFVEKSISYKREHQSSCVIVQGEPYYLKSAFKDIETKLLTPVINFSKGWKSAETDFLKVGSDLGFTQSKIKAAFNKGIQALKTAFINNKKLGKVALKEIEKNKNNVGLVVFGRPYNAFAQEANFGIPRKIASKGHYIIPFDSLSFEDEKSMENMTWAIGQDIIKAINYVKKHPQLFPIYITNFSCGPDSFLLTYMRDIMKSKPSLTLELDSHSADAGINTRIEAFLDIVDQYLKMNIKDPKRKNFTPAQLIMEDRQMLFQTSDLQKVTLKHKNVKILFPSMGRRGSELFAAAFKGIGLNSQAVDLPNFNTLMKGRNNTSCKECLPLILTTGSLLEYLEKKNDDELLVYFMPTSSGNCRFSQYYIFLRKLIEKKQIKNVTLLTLKSENNYAGIGALDQFKILKSVIVSDIMDDIQNSLRVLAKDKESANKIFLSQWGKIISSFENGAKDLKAVLRQVSSELAKIEIKQDLASAKKVLMAGEIYVRKDDFSTEMLLKTMEEKDIIVHRSPILEWLYYVDLLVEKGFHESDKNWKNKLEMLARKFLQKNTESSIKKILSKSGLYKYEMIDIKKIVEIGENFIDLNLTGESIIVTGAFFKEVASHYDGLISVGPFACLPTRLIESILSQESKILNNPRVEKLVKEKNIDNLHSLPFLSVEIDGNPLPQIIESRVEAFALQVKRLKY